MKQIFENKKVQTLVIIIFILLMCMADNIFGQPFASIGIVNKGAKFEAGTSIKKVELKLSYQRPFTSNENKIVTTLAIGYEVDINDRFYLMPGAGYAYRKWTDFSEYDKGGQMIPMKDFSPVVNMEVGVNGYAGNLYSFVNYCGNDVYFGIGIKFYPSKL